MAEHERHTHKRLVLLPCAFVSTLQQQQQQHQPAISVRMLLLLVVVALFSALVPRISADSRSAHDDLDFMLPHASTSTSAPWRRIAPPEGCTAMAVGRMASASLAPMTTHTNDCKDCDFRLSIVPSQPLTCDQRRQRPVFASSFSFPRFVGDRRGSTLTLAALHRENIELFANWNHSMASQPIGYVPLTSDACSQHADDSHMHGGQERTYAYIDGTYGIQNEYGVSMGESTCAARLVSRPVFAPNGSALFDVSELARAALEQARSARQAIAIMGELAERYGYYGAEWEGPYAQAEAGEALLVADARDAWVFHITPDDTGSSAVWVAQRVPSTHMSVIANAFTIQRVDLNDPHNFMASANLYTVAQRLGIYRPDAGAHDRHEDFNFARIYGLAVSFEQYCSRRMWRAYTLALNATARSTAASLELAHSLGLEDDKGVLELPFSIPLPGQLSVSDLFAIQRDHYEGTKFDLTQGAAAGPFGNPNRYDRGEGGGVPMNVLMQGSFERPISMFRTSYSFVTESRTFSASTRSSASPLPRELASRVWFAPAMPHASFYTPLYANALTLPPAMTRGSLYAYDTDSAWWSVTAIGNWMERAFMHMVVDVKRVQAFTEDALWRAADQFERDAISSTSFSHSNSSSSSLALCEALTSFQNQYAQHSSSRWLRLFHHLIAKYHDGYRIDSWYQLPLEPTALFYPYDWLIDVGFFGERGQAANWDVDDWSYVSEHNETSIAKRRRHPHVNNSSVTRNTSCAACRRTSDQEANNLSSDDSSNQCCCSSLPCEHQKKRHHQHKLDSRARREVQEHQGATSTASGFNSTFEREGHEQHAIGGWFVFLASNTVSMTLGIALGVVLLKRQREEQEESFQYESIAHA